MAGIKKNFFYQSIYQILAIILPLVTSPYIARVLGAERIGVFSYTYSVANYFVLFAMLGLNNYGNREIALVRDDKERMNRTFNSILSLHLVLSVIVLVLYYLYVFFVVKEDLPIAFIQSFYVIGALFDINWFYFGIEKFKLTVARNIIIKLMTVVLIFLLVKEKSDLWKYAMIMAVGSFISQLVVWFPLKKYVKFVVLSWNEIKKHVVPMAILFIPVIAVSLYKMMDKIMLGSMINKVQVGLYENSEKAINIPIGIISAFGTVMMPRMANLSMKKDANQSRRYLSLSMEFVSCLAVGMCFGIAGVSKEFSVVFWGEEFEACASIIVILSVSILFWSVANVIRTQYLIPYKRDSIYIRSVCIGAIVNLVINLFLIPHYYATGAAIGTVFAEASVCCVQIFGVKKELPICQYFRRTVLFLPIGIAMFEVVKCIGNIMGNHITTLLVQILAGGSFYIALSFLYLLKIRNEVLTIYIEKIRERYKK